MEIMITYNNDSYYSDLLYTTVTGQKIYDTKKTTTPVEKL